MLKLPLECGALCWPIIGTTSTSGLSSARQRIVACVPSPRIYGSSFGSSSVTSMPTFQTTMRTLVRICLLFMFFFELFLLFFFNVFFSVRLVGCSCALKGIVVDVVFIPMSFPFFFFVLSFSFFIPAFSLTFGQILRLIASCRRLAVPIGCLCCAYEEEGWEWKWRRR